MVPQGSSWDSEAPLLHQAVSAPRPPFRSPVTQQMELFVTLVNTGSTGLKQNWGKQKNYTFSWFNSSLKCIYSRCLWFFSFEFSNFFVNFQYIKV